MLDTAGGLAGLSWPECLRGQRVLACLGWPMCLLDIGLLAGLGIAYVPAGASVPAGPGVIACLGWLKCCWSGGASCVLAGLGWPYLACPNVYWEVLTCFGRTKHLLELRVQVGIG